jgi:hypothetical protein
MATVIAPQDGRPQYTFAGLAVSNAAFGRPTLAEVQQIGPDRYILPNAWPAPKASNFSSSVAASAVEPEAPKSPAARLWPNLPRGGA